MKKFKRMLAGLACVLAVCLCTPTAFAAKVIIYFDANGGTCTSAAERTNDEGKLGSLPGASMEGYTFDGWYEDIVGGTAIKASKYNFKEEGQTLYAHWTVADGSTSSAAAAQPEETKPTKTFKIEEHMGEILIVGTTVLVFTLVALHG